VVVWREREINENVICNTRNNIPPGTPICGAAYIYVVRDILPPKSPKYSEKRLTPLQSSGGLTRAPYGPSYALTRWALFTLCFTGNTWGCDILIFMPHAIMGACKLTRGSATRRALTCWLRSSTGVQVYTGRNLSGAHLLATVIIWSPICAASGAHLWERSRNDPRFQGPGRAVRGPGEGPDKRKPPCLAAWGPVEGRV